MKIVILHGWGQNAQLWKFVASKLGKDTIAFDLPGFGGQKIVDPNWGVPEYANWVENKIKSYKNVILIGHSFGGRITTEIASKNPKWLKGIVLSGSPSLYRPSLKTKIKILIFKILGAFIPYRVKASLLPRDLIKARIQGLEKTFRKVVIYDQTAQLKNINVPTLLIWGENDQDAPLRIAEEINQLIIGSELKVIDNVGHNSFDENPNLFSSYVKKFIENIK